MRRKEIQSIISGEIESRIREPVVKLLYQRYVDYGLLETSTEILSSLPQQYSGPLLHTLRSHVTKEKPILTYAIGESQGMELQV